MFPLSSTDFVAGVGTGGASQTYKCLTDSASTHHRGLNPLFQAQILQPGSGQEAQVRPTSAGQILLQRTPRQLSSLFQTHTLQPGSHRRRQSDPHVLRRFRSNAPPGHCKFLICMRRRELCLKTKLGLALARLWLQFGIHIKTMRNQ